VLVNQSLVVLVWFVTSTFVLELTPKLHKTFAMLIKHVLKEAVFQVDVKNSDPFHVIQTPIVVLPPMDFVSLLLVQTEVTVPMVLNTQMQTTKLASEFKHPPLHLLQPLLPFAKLNM